MTSKTRKRLWPVSLVMAVAIVGVMAAFLMMASSPTNTQAHDGVSGSGHCDDLGFIGKIAHDEDPNNDHTCAEGQTAPPPTGPDGNGDTMAMDNLTSSSTSASAGIKLTLDIGALPMNLKDGSSIVLYLEDDYKVPDDIDRGDVYFIAPDADDNPALNNGGRVFATYGVEISDDDHFGGDDDWDIQIFVPDFDTRDLNDARGFQAPGEDDSLQLVITKAAGIKNPSEAHDSDNTYEKGYQWSYKVLDPGASVPDAPSANKDDDLFVRSKIALDDEDNDRGYELTVTGSGFNNGTSAAVHVLHMPNARFNMAAHWETLNCAQMKAAMDSENNEYCFHYDLDTSAMTYELNTSDGARGGHADFMALSDDAKKARSNHVISRLLCGTVLRDGARAGIATVASDDTVAVTFEVTVPTFQAGDDNYICMADGEGRASVSDVEQFLLQDSLRVVPGSANAGDTINVFAQDFPTDAGSLTELRISNEVVWPRADAGDNYVPLKLDGINDDGSGTITFELPGSINGIALEGTVRIDVNYGGTKEDGKITITGSALRLSQGEVRANESITIQGEGFGGQTHVCKQDITMDGVVLRVDSASLDGEEDCDMPGIPGEAVQVSNAGQFVATVAIWRDGDSGDNPSLISGTHTIRVRDSAGFFGTATIVIKEPSITVRPLVAGPRDVITIAGENWPVDNPDGGNVDSVEIEIDDDPNRIARKYTAIPDLTGRFTFEHRVSRDVGIPSDNQIKVTYGENSEIVKIGSFAVPESIIEVSPAEAQPGEMISLSVSGMPVYTNVYSIEVGGRNVLGGQNFSTDRTGAVTSDVTVPGLDPGVYSVIMQVGEEQHRVIAIGEVEILSEGAIGTEVTAAEGLANLGDNLVAVFHFNNAAKEWSFYDPRPEFADLNTLENMVQGEAYWILIAEDVDEVVLNNKVRSLTCRGDDCWNLEVW